MVTAVSIRTVKVPTSSRVSIVDVINEHAPLFHSIACSIIDNCILDRDVVIVAPREDPTLVEEIASSLKDELSARHLEIKLSPPIYVGDSVMVIGSSQKRKTKFEGMEAVGTWIELSDNAARPVYTEPDRSKTAFGYGVDAINFGPDPHGDPGADPSARWPRNAPSDQERANQRAFFALSCGMIIRICAQARTPMHP